jgi:hypothetical protein
VPQLIAFDFFEIITVYYLNLLYRYTEVLSAFKEVGMELDLGVSKENLKFKKLRRNNEIFD